ncbi:hypothetical protein AGMMS4952_25820 [Spirochaetia bacterium]|nr:hypothetical protein AGMMS4952_25820 [Spirochaetia bacterium]
MKNVFKLMGALAMIFVLGSCVNTETPQDDGPHPGTDGVDWTNYQTAGTYSIILKNNSNRNLVAFRSSLTAANILGGIEKNETTHGIKREKLSATGGFSIIFITEEDYVANKSNLYALDQKPFTRIFAMYNAAGSNETPFEVSGNLGGTNKLIINNNTAYNMELRENTARGKPLGYAPYEANNTELYMNNGDYDIFPVFKTYNAVRDEIITIYPRTALGYPRGNLVSFDGSANREKTIYAKDYIGNPDGYSTGAAYLVVHNNSGAGVRVFQGDTLQRTETGINILNNGETRTFTILMDPLGAAGAYDTKKALSNWTLRDVNGQAVTIKYDTPAEGDTAGYFTSDYRYMVIVSGSWDLGPATASAPVRGSKIDLGNTDL